MGDDPLMIGDRRGLEEDVPEEHGTEADATEVENQADGPPTDGPDPDVAAVLVATLVGGTVEGAERILGPLRVARSSSDASPSDEDDDRMPISRLYERVSNTACPVARLACWTVSVSGSPFAILPMASCARSVLRESTAVIAARRVNRRAEKVDLSPI